jgi:hypothetical protein
MRKRSRRLDTEEKDDKKGRQPWPDVANLWMFRDKATAWWRTQFQSNPSPPSNSLLTGKLTGNFVESACLVRFLKLTRVQIQRLAAKFPTQQNREFLQRNREFVRENREFEPGVVQSDFRMTFSEGTPQSLGYNS